MSMTTAKPPETRKRACQSKLDEMTPASGMPTAPPIPSVALISATPEPTLSAGRWSRDADPDGDEAGADPGQTAARDDQRERRDSSLPRRNRR